MFNKYVLWSEFWSNFKFNRYHVANVEMVLVMSFLATVQVVRALVSEYLVTPWNLFQKVIYYIAYITHITAINIYSDIFHVNTSWFFDFQMRNIRQGGWNHDMKWNSYQTPKALCTNKWFSMCNFAFDWVLVFKYLWRKWIKLREMW